MMCLCDFFFFSSRRRHTRCALVTGVQTCALPICRTHWGRDLTVDRDQDYYGADELCAVGRRRSRQVECVAAPVERGVECNIAAQHVDVLLSDGANDLQPAVNRRAAATARGSLPVASGLQPPKGVVASAAVVISGVAADMLAEIGRASCRERVCQYV